MHFPIMHVNLRFKLQNQALTLHILNPVWDQNEDGLHTDSKVLQFLTRFKHIVCNHSAVTTLNTNVEFSA